MDKSFIYETEHKYWANMLNIRRNMKMKVVRIPEDYEGGWQTTPCRNSREMVGHVGNVTYFDSRYGVQLNNNSWWPFFVLEPVKEKKEKKISKEKWYENSEYLDKIESLIDIEGRITKGKRYTVLNYTQGQISFLNDENLISYTNSFENFKPVEDEV